MTTYGSSKKSKKSTSAILNDLNQRELSANSTTVKGRQLGHVSLFREFKNLKTFPENSLHFYADVADAPIPVFSIKFSKKACNGRALACVDEEGYLTVLDTRAWCDMQIKQNDTKSYRIEAESTTAVGGSSKTRAAISVLVHQNAVFDVCWLGDDENIATASGDQTVRITDTTTWKPVCSLSGHRGSVKVVREKPCSNGNILCSAARDGNVMIWDTRCSDRKSTSDEDSVIRPVLCLRQAHAKNFSPLGEKSSKRRRTLESTDSLCKKGITTSHGVTGLAFNRSGASELFFTSGAVDGSIKLWDIRKFSSTLGNSVEPLAKCCPGCDEELSYRPHGISSLEIDNRGKYLMACSTDSRVYLYYPNQIDAGAKLILHGSHNTSFYVKGCFSPDGDFALTGSCDSKAYLWDLSLGKGSVSSLYPVIELGGHQGEVSDVAWCQNEPGLVATSGDDCIVNLWQGDSFGQVQKENLIYETSPISATLREPGRVSDYETPRRKTQQSSEHKTRTPLQPKSITEYFNKMNSPASNNDAKK
eukprot:jgi/Galph1/1961/GphlegSOOS_G629.1